MTDIATPGGPLAAGRRAAVERFVQLRPTVLARMNEKVPAELHAEFESITVHQMKALVRLPEAGLTMHQLASSLGITGATACALADRLVAQGLAARGADPGDRRVVRLRPSPRGGLLAERYREAQREGVASLFAMLSDAQVTAWLEIMETLAASPAKMVGSGA